jgi:hypothetical protein
MKKKLYIETSVWYSGKAVEEVWAWRDALAKELEKIPENDRVNYLNEKALEGCRNLNIKCRAPKKEHTKAA